MRLKRMTKAHWLLSLAAVALLSGCAHDVASFQEATKKLEAENPKVEAFVAPHHAGEVKNGWVASFGDEKLVKLVEEAQRHNPDLRVAASRVERAMAAMRLSDSGLYPRVDILGNFTDRDGSNKDRGTFVGAVSWEPDIWGRLQNLVAADEATMQAFAADFAWARQSLAATTAKAWYRLNTDKMLRDFMAEVVKLQQKAHEIAVAREEIGSGTKRDVHLVNAMLFDSKQQLENFRILQELDTRNLETLVGRYPAGAIEPGSLPDLHDEVPAGVPAGLLNRRPDLIAARQRVAAAFHNEKAMELLKLPSLYFSFQAGYDHVENTLAKLIGSLFMPVIDNGEIDAYIAMATAEQKAAIANYRSVVLRAFKEAENTLMQERLLETRYDYLTRSAKEYETAYHMTEESYEIGDGTLIDVLTAQSKWIDASVARVRVANQRLANRINLYLALGGGFDDRPAFEPVVFEKEENGK
ncbi:TolC family protein [Hydrogenimonas sp.]